jgi:hypothetical protein
MECRAKIRRLIQNSKFKNKGNISTREEKWRKRGEADVIGSGSAGAFI